METKPKLIVFDLVFKIKKKTGHTSHHGYSSLLGSDTLDLTLWPFRTDHCRRPFQCVSLGVVKDLEDNHYKLYPDVFNVLTELTLKNYTLAIASRIEDISTAYQLLISFNISHFFEYKEIYPCTKTVHFNWLNLKSHIPFQQMIFFDDDKRNIHRIAKLGVRTYLIKDNKGITFDDLLLSNIQL